MRVMLVAQYFWPESVGAGVWLHQLATALADQGHQVTMVTAFPHYPQGRIFPGYRGGVFRRELVQGVEVIRTFIYATPRRSFWPRLLSYGSFCASALLGCLSAERPDVIFCVLPPLPLGWTTELVGRVRRVPVVINVQDLYPDLAVALGYLRNRLAIRFFQRLERSIYQRAARVVVITESFRDNLRDKGVPPEKIQVVPNWADAAAIQPGLKQNAFRRALGIEQDFTVMYSGSLGHNTCLESVVEAARLLAGERFQFVLVGEGVHKPALEARAREYGLNNLRFLPFQPAEVYPQVLAASDVQLVALHSAATQMSLPSKVFKIMASGRPLLALARPESDLQRLVARARCGLCVDPSDPAALAAALRRLAQDPAALNRMGENARRYLVENFDRRRCVVQLEALLESATREPGPAGHARRLQPSQPELPRRENGSRVSGHQWAIKRVVEWVLALALLVLALPLQLLLALAIKLDSPGPAFFAQERLGRGGKVFKMHKLRTLRWQPEAPPVLNPDGSSRVESEDARLTRLGRWLRTGWDELPQLINVLKGDMALIGPRPDEPFQRQFYRQHEEKKLSVLPGITGLPQAAGRNAIPWKQRIALDLYYIEHYSLGLDLKIALRTGCALLRRRGTDAAQNPTAQTE